MSSNDRFVSVFTSSSGHGFLSSVHRDRPPVDGISVHSHAESLSSLSGTGSGCVDDFHLQMVEFAITVVHVLPLSGVPEVWTHQTLLSCRLFACLLLRCKRKTD